MKIKAYFTHFLNRYLVGLVVVVGVLLTGILTEWRFEIGKQKASAYLNQHVETLKSNISSEIEHASFGLLGARGMIAVTGTPTYSQFNRYVQTRNMAKEFPGVLGFGFIERVPDARVQHFEKMARQQIDQKFTVHQLPGGVPTPIRYIIKYIEPLARNQAALGLDLGSDPNRTNAIAMAIDSGEPALTNVIQLVQVDRKENAFLLLVPVYRNGVISATLLERREQLVGILYAPVVISDLFKGIVNDMQHTVQFSLREKDSGDLWFDAERGYTDSLHQSDELTVFNKRFVLDAKLSPDVQANLIGHDHYFVLLTGGMLTLLSALVTQLLIRQRQEAYQNARQNLSLLKDLVDNAPYGLVVYDSQLHVVFENELFKKLFGLSDVAGGAARSLKDVVAASFVQGYYAAGESLDAVYDRVRYEIAAPGAQSRLLRLANDTWVECQISHISQNMIVIAYVDVTTLKLKQVQLEAAVASAEAANHAKSAFLATMSHETRTPLNAIIGTAYLLSTSELTEDQRSDMQTIETASKNLLMLINDILDFSKIEAGELDFESRPFQLSEVLQDMQTMFASSCAQKKIALEVGSRPATLSEWLDGDQHRVKQMLMNLLSNAIKFTETGTVSLCVEHLQDQDLPDKAMVRFSIVDTGIGIKPEALGKLFDPFVQEYNSTTRVFGGTGLGLAIVKRIAELMGGCISVSSEPGKGSVFNLDLPFGAADEIAAISNNFRVSRQLEVLIAEDDPVDGRLLKSISESFGWKVEIVTNGKAVIDRLVEKMKINQRIDCIILDWHLPVMDGVEVFARLKDCGLQYSPSVIMVTADDLHVLKLKAERLVPDSVLVKPIVPSSLYNAVNNAVVAETGRHDSLVKSTQISRGHSKWLNGLRILIVDDSKINLEVVARLLSAEGALPTCCVNGKEALAVLASTSDPFDFVLMDLQMPEMDGCEVTEQIRADDRFKDMPIFALTAGATTTEQRRAVGVGMNGFLTKPIDPVTLIRSIRYFFLTNNTKGLPLHPM